MKAIVFSDLHLKPGSESVVFDYVLPGIAEAARQQKCDHVLFLGDWYTLRYQVSLNLQNRCLDFFRAENGITWHILAGNHDQYDTTGRNALEVFDELPNVKVYTEPTKTDFGFFVPYRLDHDEIKQLLANDDSEIAYLHTGIVGALQNSRITCERGVNPSVLDKYNLVLSGHYHKRQTLGSRNHVHYVGSPYETRADESGDPKGYGILDTNSVEWRWVNANWGPKHYRVKPDQLDVSSLKKGDVVRVEIESEREIEALSQPLRSLGIKHTFVLKNQKSENRLKVAADANIEDYAKTYVDEFAPANLDKGKLLAAFRAL